MKLRVFGEILWDIFGEDKRIGGAPFNFAAHSAALGANVEMISAVGRDELGDEALKIAAGYGMDTANIAVLDGVETGCCIVTLKDGQPSYNLKQGVAYDMIPEPAGEARADAFYFGTLAARSEISRKTLEKLLDNGKYGEIFFDINIRQKFYSKELIDWSLNRCTVLKISEEEIGVLELLGIGGSVIECARQLAEQYGNLKYVIVTLGKAGSVLFDCRNGKMYLSPKPSGEPVSAVGAGDSFSACFLCSMLAGRTPEECLAGATELADYVVSQLGAIPELPAELAQKLCVSDAENAKEEITVNEALNNLLTRRSCRKFSDRQVAEAQLSDILKAGTYAPTAMGRQSPLIVVIQDKELVQQVEKLNAAVMGKEDSHPFYGAPTVLVVFGDAAMATGTADANLVIGNLLNAAHAVGVDSCYIWRAKESFESEEGLALKKAWGVPDNYAGMGNVILGYGLPEGRREAAARKEGYVIVAKAPEKEKPQKRPFINKKKLDPTFKCVYAGPELRNWKPKNKRTQGGDNKTETSQI